MVIETTFAAVHPGAKIISLFYINNIIHSILKFTSAKWENF